MEFGILLEIQGMIETWVQKISEDNTCDKNIFRDLGYLFMYRV